MRVAPPRLARPGGGLPVCAAGRRRHVGRGRARAGAVRPRLLPDLQRQGPHRVDQRQLLRRHVRGEGRHALLQRQPHRFPAHRPHVRELRARIRLEARGQGGQRWPVRVVRSGAEPGAEHVPALGGGADHAHARREGQGGPPPLHRAGRRLQHLGRQDDAAAPAPGRLGAHAPERARHQGRGRVEPLQGHL